MSKLWLCYRDTAVLGGSLQLLRELVKKRGPSEGLGGPLQAVSRLLKGPPEDTEIRTQLFELCVCLRRHSLVSLPMFSFLHLVSCCCCLLHSCCCCGGSGSGINTAAMHGWNLPAAATGATAAVAAVVVAPQAFSESPTLLSFMLGPFPGDSALEKRQLDYWFGGEEGGLPEAPSTRISFLLSTGLTKATAKTPHILRLLTAAVCHRRSQKRPSGGHEIRSGIGIGSGIDIGRSASSSASYAVAGQTATSSPHSLSSTSLAACLLACGASHTSNTVGISDLRSVLLGVSWKDGDRFPDSSGVGVSKETETVSFSYLSQRAASVASLAEGQQPPARQRFWLGPSWRGAPLGGPLPANVSKGDSSVEVPHREAETIQMEPHTLELNTLLRREPRKGPLSRAAAVAMQERRNQRGVRLLQRHLNALAGCEETVVLERPPDGTEGDSLESGEGQEFLLQLLNRACQLSPFFSQEFLLLLLHAHKAPAGARDPACTWGSLGTAEDVATAAADVLGLGAAAREALEQSLRDSTGTADQLGDSPFFSLLQRLTLHSLLLSPPASATAATTAMEATAEGSRIYPTRLLELARKTETLDAARPLLEELTCMQQRVLLGGLAHQQNNQQQKEEAGKAVCKTLLPYFISLFRVYRDLGEAELQTSTLQLLSLYRCVSLNTAEALLQLYSGGPTDARLLAPSGGTPKWQRQICAATAGEETQEETEHETDLRPLMREAELQALQRMMQYVSFLLLFAASLSLPHRLLYSIRRHI